jgi:hypothetical protein
MFESVLLRRSLKLVSFLRDRVLCGLRVITVGMGDRTHGFPDDGNDHLVHVPYGFLVIGSRNGAVGILSKVIRAERGIHS